MPFFKTIDEFVKFESIDINMDFNTLLPKVKDAEKKFIKPLLGNFYDILLADYTDHTTAEGVDNGMNADNWTVLPLVQNALAKYTLYLGIESFGVNIGNTGIQQSFGQNTQPAPRWKIRDLKSSYLQHGDDAAEELLTFLEENAAANKYGSWFADFDANTKMSGIIVNSVRVASKYAKIVDSRRLFLQLKPAIQSIESEYIKKLICADQYTEIVTQLQTGSLSANNAKLVQKLEPLIVKMALYETIPHLRIRISPEGIQLLSVSDSSVIQQPASASEVDKLLCSLKEGLTGYVNNEETAKKFITENISDYPLIANSPCYRSSPTNRNYVVDNDSSLKHFSV